MQLTTFAAVVASCLTIGHAAEEPHERSFFMIGGGYTDDGDGGHVWSDQMYVEKLSPVDGPTQDAPLVLIHGGGQTGTNFLNKPDGGRGWASDFIRDGYDVYVLDQTLRGRSAWQEDPSVRRAISAEQTEERFTHPDGSEWPQGSKHTQWPGAGVMGDPIFDAFYSSTLPYEDNATITQTTMQAAGAALLDHIGRPAVVAGHSQGGAMPLVIADARPELIKGLILLEPKGPPFQEAVFSETPAREWGMTDIPVAYTPPVKDASELVKKTYPARDNSSTKCIRQAEKPAPRQLTNLKDLDMLIVTTEASYHAMYDHCSLEYFRQAGCHKTKHISLGEIGILGNGHMMFMEKNSHDIQQVLHGWIQKLD